MKIRIIGSMKFHDKYKEIEKKLENKGHKIIVPLPDEYYSKEENIKRKAMEDFNKDLEKSDAILIANFDKNEIKNHIGVNTLMEIGMAFNRNKKIFILNKIPENCIEELRAIGVIELNGNLNQIK
jgi:predicted metal-dependent peptidase